MKRLTLNFRSVPWPMQGDLLFKDDSDWWHNAHLDRAGKSWGIYAAGYKEAADLLARRFLKNHQSNDILTYPMVFLYRHCLELRLKEVILTGQELLDEQIDIPLKILDDHGLEKLWQTTRDILEKLGERDLWPKRSIKQFDNVERLIKEFGGKDKMGINFRYPCTKRQKGSEPTLPNLSRVGVRNFYKVMQRLDSFFSAQIEGIDYYLNGYGSP